MILSPKAERAWAYGIVVAVALIFRLVTLNMPETGGDSIHYFDCAWQLWHQPQSYTLDHQSARWGIILPIAVIRPIFGWGPLVYSFIALGVALLTVIAILRAGELLKSLFTGVVAALVFTFFPGVIDVASNLTPESFLPLYLSLTTMLLLEYRRRSSGGTGYLIAAGLVYVLAWFTKITVVEFLPAFLLLIYQRNRQWGALWTFVGIFVAAVALETLVYKLIWHEPLGIVSVILHSHLAAANDDTMTVLSSIWGLAGRFAPHVFRFYWWPLVIVAAVLFVYLIRKRNMSPVWFLVLGEVLFFLGLTFGIKSFHPVVTLEPFVTRYFMTGLPLLILFVAFGLSEFLDSMRWGWLNTISLSLAGLIGIVGVVALISLPVIPAKWKARFLPLDGHPFVVMPKYIALAETRRHEHFPVIGFNPGDPVQSVKAAAAYFTLFDRPTATTGADIVPLDAASGAVRLSDVATPSTAEAQVVWVKADPLEIRLLTWGELQKLGVQ
jgi:hypothetical protein